MTARQNSLIAALHVQIAGQQGPRTAAHGMLRADLRGVLHAAASTWHEWRRRRSARRALAAIDARTLRDAGISPDLAEYEMQQPFWRPLRNWRD